MIVKQKQQNFVDSTI